MTSSSSLTSAESSVVTLQWTEGDSERDADEQQGRIDEDGEMDNDWRLTASYY